MDFRAVLLVGLSAGLVLGAASYFLVEPVFDITIKLEQSGNAGDSEPETMSRGEQHIGLWIGSLIYGVAVTAIFGLVYEKVSKRVHGLASKPVFLAGLIYLLVFLLPFLKYPSNPAGVGSASTLYYRQLLYVSYLILTVVGTVGSWLLSGFIVRRIPMLRRLFGLTIVAVYWALLYLVMPSNPDSTASIPAKILLNFRILSFLTQTIFWLSIGVLWATYQKIGYRYAGLHVKSEGT